MMHSPGHMSIQEMTPDAQALVLNKLETTAWTNQHYQYEINNIIKFIQNGNGSDGKEFLTKMQRTDEYRQQSFKDTHLEIALAMGYE